MRFLFFLFLFISVKVFGQISSSQQKALNNYILYADRSAEEISSIVTSVVEYYPSIQQQKKNKNSFFKDYRCPVQLEEYYYKTAIAESKTLGTSATSLTQKLNALKSVAEKIDANCKALDTYYKLEDYKKDNFVGAEELIGEFPISEEVFSMADKFSKEDISITVFNFGKTTASTKNLEKLSKKGRGNYEHITKENVEFKLIREAQARKKR